MAQASSHIPLITAAEAREKSEEAVSAMRLSLARKVPLALRDNVAGTINAEFKTPCRNAIVIFSKDDPVPAVISWLIAYDYTVDLEPVIVVRFRRTDIPTYMPLSDVKNKADVEDTWMRAQIARVSIERDMNPRPGGGGLVFVNVGYNVFWGPLCVSAQKLVSH